MKVLIIQGAGMNMRGKVDIEIFGPMTLEQLNDTIRRYAAELDVDVEFCQSNLEGEVVNALYSAHEGDIDAALINPAGFMRTTGPLPTAIGQVRFPVIEVHVSNPVARGNVSSTLPRCRGSVTGFGPFSYWLALAAAKEIVKAGQRDR
ncbi:MAG: type II 3-dehydroquinate dehydratase [Chloroflexota bacterium]